MIVLYCLALLPIRVTLSLAGLAADTFAVGAILLGGGLLATAVQLYRTASDTWARRLFWATVIYLPVLLGLLLADGGRSAEAEPNVKPCDPTSSPGHPRSSSTSAAAAGSFCCRC